MPNPNLSAARRNKKDEFYTQLSDIENELRHYHDLFEGKVIYCNCDDPRVSNFFYYFSSNFKFLKIKKLIATCYKNQQPDLFSSEDSEKAVFLEYDGENGTYTTNHPLGVVKPLKGNGDFRNSECIELLKQSDIVVTNPPFSLFREYIAQLIEYNKKFLIIGPRNAIIYKEVFPEIKNDRIWLGFGFVAGNAYFETKHPENFASGVYNQETGLVKFRNVVWYTNLPHEKRNEELYLWKKYSAEEYPHYDNYDAIEVSKVVNIPRDWNGAMGVPITFLDKYNPSQFEIIGRMNSSVITDLQLGIPYVNGVAKYARIIIQRR
ncbi:MAG: modification methylase [Bacteroidetes bacterium]|nr:modification methylase [Bacteroidota bacterium]